MTDTRIAELLDEWTPSYDDRVGDWERVAAEARLERIRGLRATPLRLGAVAAAIAAAAALLLAWAFNNQHVSLVDRALAAVGDGPVLHAVLRGEWGGTLVDLTGDRRPIYGDNEVWFDTRSGLTHQIERLGGAVQGEELYKPKKPAAELAALGREYKQALESGTARVTGSDTIGGEPVVWITIHSELLPDVADGKGHEWAQQVAVSKRTYKPVALRETRDRKPGPETLQHVLNLQLIARDEADFTTSRPSREGTAFEEDRDAIPLEQAASPLGGQTPLWLGRDYNGLPLAQVYRETTSAGHQQRARLTGAKAQAAIKCSQQRENGGNCFRQVGVGSVEVRPDGVFITRGPIQWSEEQSSVVLFYGTIGDDSSTYHKDQIPLYDKPYIILTESTQASPFRRFVGTYVPPEGSVFLTAGNRTGVLHRGEIHITVEAANQAEVLAAARALMPMPLP